MSLVKPIGSGPPPVRPGQRRHLAGRFLTYGLLAVWSLVCLFPLYWVAVTSLKGEAEIVGGPFFLPFIDFSPSTEAWATVLTDPIGYLPGRFANSLIVASGATFLTVLVGAFAAYGLSRFRYVWAWERISVLSAIIAAAAIAFLAPHMLVPAGIVVTALLGLVVPAILNRQVGRPAGNSAILVGMIATRVLPPVILVVPLHIMAERGGLLDTRTALVVAYSGMNLPLAIWLLYSQFGPRAGEVEEAAMLDGASRLRIFAEIFLPGAVGSIAAAALLVFVLSWNEYLFAAFLTGTHAVTLPPWLVGQMSTGEAQIGGDQVEWSRLSAATVLMILPLVAATAFAQRYWGGIALAKPGT